MPEFGKLGSGHRTGKGQFSFNHKEGHCQILFKLPHAAAAAKSLQVCLTLCDPIDNSSPGSPILGILQAKALEWVAISFSNV